MEGRLYPWSSHDGFYPVSALPNLCARAHFLHVSNSFVRATQNFYTLQLHVPSVCSAQLFPPHMLSLCIFSSLLSLYYCEIRIKWVMVRTSIYRARNAGTIFDKLMELRDETDHCWRADKRRIACVATTRIFLD